MIYEALQRIERAGFILQECKGLLSVEPAHKLSEVQRQWIERHQQAIIRQLQAKRNVDVLAIMDAFQADVMSLNGVNTKVHHINGHT